MQWPCTIAPTIEDYTRLSFIYELWAINDWLAEAKYYHIEYQDEKYRHNINMYLFCFLQ